MRVVVVGASIAGVRTAQALRREGFPGPVTVVGAESHLPYDKPPLSKQFLAGAWDSGRITLLSAEDAERSGITLRLGSAARELDVAARTVRLEDGDVIDYDAVVIATGADARPSPWSTASGVHVLRSLDDSLALREALGRGGPVVVVGGGFIGSEVASTARSLGVDTILVDPSEHPLSRIVGEQCAAAFSGLHSRHGVRTRFGAGVQHVTGQAGALEVSLTDGTVLQASTVVVGIGASPTTAWLVGSGVPIDDGVVCDADGRVEGCPGVYAVGDVAAWSDDDGQPSRREHWTHATEQAAHVARQIAGTSAGEPFRASHFVWSDQHDWKIQFIGRPTATTYHSCLGQLDAVPARAALLYTSQTGALTGAVTVNWARMAGKVRLALAAGAVPADLAG